VSEPTTAGPDVRSSAAELRARGFALCRVDAGTKRTRDRGWTARSAEPDEFGPDDLVGVMGGPLSDGGRPGHALVVIDLDSAEAVGRADAYLPPTGMAEGRPGKPRSHRYYLVPLDSVPPWGRSAAEQGAAAAVRAAGHPGPFKKGFAHRATGERVIDFIGTGGQVVCPPSAHPSGEARAWEGGAPGDPAVVPFVALWDAVGRLASSCGAAVPRVLPAAHRPSAPRPSAPALQRAAAYLKTVPPAIGGQRGHDATFWAARTMAWGFDLAAEESLRLLLEHFNPRCQPPWTERELRHKVEDADALPFDKPRGWLRDAERARPPAAGAAGRNGKAHEANGHHAANGKAEAAGEVPPAAGHARRYRPVPAHVAFPTYLLPEPLRSFVRQAAQAIGCDEAYAGLPALVAAASAIGNARHVELKPGWTEPPVIWAAVVGDSGTRKSPPFRLAMRPLQDADARYRDEFRAALGRYNALTSEARADRDANPPPARRRALTEDTTIESLAGILADNPRGLVNARDEIEDWFQSQTRYKGKAGGSDRSRWLTLWRADTLTVDRKTGPDPEQRSVHVPLAACSIVGTIQPGVLAAALDRMARESGLAARLLLAMPPYRVSPWTEAEVHPDTLAAYDHLIRDLLALRMPTDLLRRRPRPEPIRLSPEAKGRWVEWYDALQAEKRDAGPERRATLAKLEAYAIRFALVFHVVAEVTAGRGGLDPVGDVAVQCGTQLAEWFGLEADRIAVGLAESEGDREVSELVEWIRARGRQCTVRELMSRRGRYKTAEDARQALAELVDLGLGTWDKKPAPRGGRTAEAFVLAPESALTLDTLDGALAEGEALTLGPDPLGNPGE
jgi:hypothetical protein